MKKGVPEREGSKRREFINHFGIPWKHRHLSQMTQQDTWNHRRCQTLTSAHVKLLSG